MTYSRGTHAPTHRAPRGTLPINASPPAMRPDQRGIAGLRPAVSLTGFLLAAGSAPLPDAGHPDDQRQYGLK